MAEFDEKAATWDDDPVRVDRAESIADSLANSIELSSVKQAMEYGSGTGLLSFALKDRLAHIVLMDESQSMIDMANEKCAAINIGHFEPLKYDLLKQPLPEYKFDLIFILLTLHHIKETHLILQKFRQLLNPNGYLAIIDLEKEDGSFHEHNTHFHNGFERGSLENQLAESGLKPISYEVCYELERGYDDVKQEYPLFLLIAQKPR
jgi:ubiquinone/menaquinone biosynthesis C-methylase UbiE